MDFEIWWWRRFRHFCCLLAGCKQSGAIGSCSNPFGIFGRDICVLLLGIQGFVFVDIFEAANGCFGRNDCVDGGAWVFVVDSRCPATGDPLKIGALFGGIVSRSTSFLCSWIRVLDKEMFAILLFKPNDSTIAENLGQRALRVPSC
jgi:hypothetical protein